MESLLESIRLALLDIRRRSLLQELRNVNQLIHERPHDFGEQDSSQAVFESRDKAA